MEPQTVVLLVMIAVAVLSLIIAVLMWIGGRRGRALQALGVATLAAGLWCTGLADLLVDAARAVVQWARGLTMTPMVWTGVVLIALTVVLWIAGSMIATRAFARRALERSQGGAASSVEGSKSTASSGGSGATDVKAASARKGAKAPSGETATKQGRKDAKGAPAEQADPEMDEIEAILRNRGIE